MRESGDLIRIQRKLGIEMGIKMHEEQLINLMTRMMKINGLRLKKMKKSIRSQ